jgi:4'-phosphopantetheinyl transferase
VTPSTLRLSPARLRVWFARLDGVAESALLEAHGALLSPDERTRLDGLQRPSVRLQYLASRVLARRTLSWCLDTDGSSLRFERGRAGKPHLVTQPGLGPVDFNLAHTRGLVLIVIGHAVAVGIDVERVERVIDEIAIAGVAFSGDELAGLVRLAPPARRRRFYELWTLKEAFLKATGEGLTGGMATIGFRRTAGGWLEPACPREGMVCRLWPLMPTPDHLAAVAAIGAEPVAPAIESIDEWLPLA